MKTIASRLAYSMQEHSRLHSAYALSEASGVPQPTISRILAGDSKDPRNGTLQKLCVALGISLVWLRDGDETQRADNNALPTTGPSRSYEYPEISEVQAGNAAEAIDLLQPGEGERHQSDAWAGQNGFWLRVRGDSMTRSGGVSFPEGMLVLVAPGVEPVSGQYIVAKIGNDVTFKQYVVDAGVRILRPLNSAYPTQVMDEKWQLVGTVMDAKWPKGVF